LYRSILACAVAIRLLLVIVVPFGGTIAHRLQGLSDEQAHFSYIAYLAQHHTFPVQTHAHVPGSTERVDFEYHQPPLYYLLCAPFYALLHGPLALYACRLVSVLCGLLSLLVLSRILSNLGCSKSRREQGVLFLALLPSHAYFSALVSNDSLAWLIGFLLTERLFALYDRARLPPDALRGLGIHNVLGLMLGLGMLTKSSLALFYPVVAFAYGYAYLRTRRPAVILCGVLALTISLSVAGVWYLRNVALYGSISALNVGYDVPREENILDAVIHLTRAAARYFWFPMQHVEPSSLVRMLRALGGLVITAHAVAALWYLRRYGLTVKTGTLGLLVVVALAAQLYVAIHWMNVEARLMYPALAAIVFFMVVPPADLLRRWGWRESFITAYFCALALHPYLFLLFARS
jgi:4-amino-4-deoxy-L-arabinose transferase-like glycosyltransferase